MINTIRRILKDEVKAQTTLTSVKGAKRAFSKGINVRSDKNSNDILVYVHKMQKNEINKIAEKIQNEGFSVDIVPGIIIVKG